MEKRTDEYRQAASGFLLKRCKDLLSNFISDQKNILGQAFASLAPEPIPIRQQRKGYEYCRNTVPPNHDRK